MHAMGPIQLIVIAAVVLVLFGRGKVSSLMGEVGKGISAFKKGVGEGQAEMDKPAETTTTTTTVVKDVTPIEKDQA
ncbi:MAG: twin-arginine translocase TatA/TatE family subunit [Pseudorhodobacter sp.]|nr:twin-arginine translocase TatA/TatE family subunit [Pseudorhodobacter sp.]